MSFFEMVSLCVTVSGIVITYYAKIRTLRNEVKTLQGKCKNTYAFFSYVMCKRRNTVDVLRGDYRYTIPAKLGEDQSSSFNIFDLESIKSQLIDYLRSYDIEINRYGQYITSKEVEGFLKYSPFDEFSEDDKKKLNPPLTMGTW